MNDFQPTHRITFTNTRGEKNVYVVSLQDDGCAYLQTEWDSETGADWAVVDGEWLFQGQATPGGASGEVEVEEIAGSQYAEEILASCERYVYVLDVSTNDVLNDGDIACAVVSLLGESGWDLEVRNPHKGEAPGIYRRDPGGLQILGYSLRMPEALDSAIRDACSRAVQS